MNNLSEGEVDLKQIQDLSQWLRDVHLDSAEEWLPVLEAQLGKEDPVFLDSVKRVVRLLLADDEFVRCVEVARHYHRAGQPVYEEVKFAFSNLVMDDRELAERLLAEWPPGKNHDSLTSSVARSLVDQGTIEDAKSFIMAIDLHEIREREARFAVAQHIKRLDEIELENYIKSEMRQNGGDNDWSHMAFEQGISNLASRKPEVLIDLLRLTPNHELLSRAVSRLRGALLLDREPDIVFEALNLLPDGPKRAQEFRTIGAASLKRDVDNALAWFGSLSSSADRVEAFRGIASAYSRIAPEEFVEWVQSEGLEVNLVETAIAELKRIGLDTEADELMQRQSDLNR